jgi:protein-tyrosine phosphatase
MERIRRPSRPSTIGRPGGALVIDLHSHILPALDDGVADLDQSVAMARAMAATGVTVVVATPHVREDYPTTPAQMLGALSRVRNEISAADVPITVLPGGEIAIDALVRLSAADRAAFWLGGRESLLLVETPYHGWSTAIELSVNALLEQGVTPVLAHPERNSAVQRRPELLEPLVRAGCVVQLTAASFEGRFGRRTAEVARDLVDRGSAHLVASDAHTPDGRGGLGRLGATLQDPGLADWLTTAVPAALLAGETLPERPFRARRRGRRWPLRRR